MMTRNLASSVLVIALGLSIPAAARAADTAATQPQTSAGLSKDEAVTIATRYFANEIAVEGSVGEPTLQGDNWVFPVKFGARAVVARDPLFVNRYTGQVSWAGPKAPKATVEQANKPSPK
jgi:hypothetical protein